MARQKIRIHLTDEEYKLLCRVVKQTKTDCWFCLDIDKEGFDCVRDLENGRKVTLRFAVDQLNDAIIPELMSLTEEEMLMYGVLMEKLELPNPFKEQLEVFEKVYAGNGNGICTEEEE